MCYHAGMQTTRASRWCPECSARLLPEETVCNKCANNTKLPPRRPCPWCGEPISRGIVVCNHCRADLTLPPEEKTACPRCGTVLRVGSTSCYRCGTRLGTSPARTALVAFPAADSPSAEGAAARVDATAPSHEGRTPVEGFRRRSWIAVGVLFAWLAALEWWGAAHARHRGWLADPSGIAGIAHAGWGGWIALRVMLSIGAGLFTVAGLILPGRGRHVVWNRWSLALAVATPTLAISRLLVLLGISLRQKMTLSRQEQGPSTEARPRAPADHPWLVLLLLVELLIAAAATIAIVLPVEWPAALPAGVQSALAVVRSNRAAIAGLLATLGVLHVLTAALGWYWQSFDEGSLTTWLSPVAVLAPLLIAGTTILLSGLGNDVGIPGGLPVQTAMIEGFVFWGALSLYGLYHVVASWPGLQRVLSLGVIGYALCIPLLATIWERRVEQRSQAIAPVEQEVASLPDVDSDSVPLSRSRNPHPRSLSQGERGVNREALKLNLRSDS